MSSDGDFFYAKTTLSPVQLVLACFFKGDSSLFDGRLGCPMASAGYFRSEYLEKEKFTVMLTGYRGLSFSFFPIFLYNEDKR